MGQNWEVNWEVQRCKLGGSTGQNWGVQRCRIERIGVQNLQANWEVQGAILGGELGIPTVQY